MVLFDAICCIFMGHQLYCRMSSVVLLDIVCGSVGYHLHRCRQMKDHWDQGTIHPKTRCWAQGMDGWRPLLSVPQLKWTFLASGQSIMNESEMAMLILSMLIKMAEYYPSRYDGLLLVRIRYVY